MTRREKKHYSMRIGGGGGDCCIGSIGVGSGDEIEGWFDMPLFGCGTASGDGVLLINVSPCIGVGGDGIGWIVIGMTGVGVAFSGCVEIEGKGFDWGT